MDSRKKGFTIIEVVIALSIFAILAVTVGTTINSTLKRKKKTEFESDIQTSMQTALTIMQTDISKAFKWVDINEEIKRKMDKEKAPTQPGQAPQGTFPIADSKIPYEKVTSFIGKSNSLYFTSLSNARTIANSPYSDQAKIAYYLKNVSSYKDGKPTQAIVRVVDPYLDEADIEKLEGTPTAILEDVKSLEFGYYDSEDEKWLKEWKSTADDSKTKDKFPPAVEIKITIEINQKEYKGSAVAMITTPGVPTGNAASSPAPGTSPTPAGGG